MAICTDENILTFLNNGLNYNRALESFNTKLYFDYKVSEKLNLSNQFNTQIANYNKFSSYGIKLYQKPMEQVKFSIHF